ncbi:MAG: outer membrane protein assembly factor BamA [Candidatus Brocadiales bacterium]
MNVHYVPLQKWYLVLIFITAPSIICFVPLSVYGVEDRIIRKIEVKGNKRISTAAIKAATRIREGDVYNPEIVNRDVDAIWAMGFFDNIEVKIEEFEDGLKLIFLLTERAVIKKIIFQGNEKLSTPRLRKIIEQKRRGHLKYYLLKLDEDKLRNLYVKKGYHFAEIESDVEITNGDAVITFIINEGPRVHIDEIRFEGNKSIKSKKLKKQIKSRARRFPSIIFPGKFKSKEFENDINELKEYYSEEGWLDANVRGEVKYSTDKIKITIIFYIDEGERYYVDTITIKGNTIFSNRELRSSLTLREGAPFLNKKFEEDTRKIKMLYGEQGFLKASVVPRRFFTPQEAKVNINYEIVEDERYYVNKIKISGNDRTKDNVIRRELNFYPGDRINTTKIRDAHRRLVDTGFFDVGSGEPTSVSFEPVPNTNKIDILVDVKEGQTGLLRFGGGFGANVGAFGDISYSDRNFDILDFPKNFHDFVSGNAFRGAGHVVTLRFSPGVFRQEAVFSFFNPAVFDSTYSFGLNFFLFKRIYEFWDEGRKGARATVGKEIFRDLFLSIVPNYVLMELDNFDDSIRDISSNIFREQEGTFSRLGLELRLIYDKKDSYYFPTRGYEIGASFEATTLDIKIARSTIYGRKYLTVLDFPNWGKHVLTLASTVGVVDTIGEHEFTKDVPFIERYFAGGYGSIRGFEFRGVSPVAKDVFGDFVQVGGNSLLLTSAEYSIPIYHDVFRAVTFVDAGKVDKKIGDLNFTNMRASAGIGMRLTIPFFGRAVIAVDYAVPFMKEPGDDTQAISFNMGSGTSF